MSVVTFPPTSPNRGSSLQDPFLLGLQQYLRRSQYNNTHASDLWSALSGALWSLLLPPLLCLPGLMRRLHCGSCWCRNAAARPLAGGSWQGKLAAKQERVALFVLEPSPAPVCSLWTLLPAGPLGIETPLMMEAWTYRQASVGPLCAVHHPYAVCRPESPACRVHAGKVDRVQCGRWGQQAGDGVLVCVPGRA